MKNIYLLNVIFSNSQKHDNLNLNWHFLERLDIRTYINFILKYMKLLISYDISMQLFTLIVVIVLEKIQWLRNKILFKCYILSAHSIVSDITQRMNEFKYLFLEYPRTLELVDTVNFTIISYKEEKKSTFKLLQI